jgi:hypothetical protein
MDVHGGPCPGRTLRVVWDAVAVGRGGWVVAAAGRPGADPAGDQRQGERPTEQRKARGRGQWPQSPPGHDQGGQRSDQPHRGRGDAGAGKQMAGVGQGEQALLGGQARVAGVQHGVPSQPDQQQGHASGPE